MEPLDRTYNLFPTLAEIEYEQANYEECLSKLQAVQTKKLEQLLSAERKAANNASVKARNIANPIRDAVSCSVSFDADSESH